MLRQTSLACCALSVLVLTGCVRTSDGSIEPRYAPTVQHVGPVPVVAMRPARREVSDTLRQRYPARPVPSLVTYSPPRATRSVRRAAPVEIRSSSGGVSCQAPSRQGERVRMDCR
ncbi:hypothetical protein [Mesorhizobium sp. CAU 1732]|uniref:hypothetical protein n=1 Tax=Mesorhizobium sp. CAU 1732 TaxID=3140358 RepID=UPI003261CA83